MGCFLTRVLLISVDLQTPGFVFVLFLNHLSKMKLILLNSFSFFFFFFIINKKAHPYVIQNLDILFIYTLYFVLTHLFGIS